MISIVLQFFYHFVKQSQRLFLFTADFFLDFLLNMKYNTGRKNKQ